MSKLRLVGVLLLAVGVGAAQAPVASSAELLPPKCEGVPAPLAKSNLERLQGLEAAGASTPGTLVAAPSIENLAMTEARLVDYADCVHAEVCYWSDVSQQTLRAQQMLDGLAESKQPTQKLALVLDIDDTSMTTYCEMKRENFAYIAPEFQAWVVSPWANQPVVGTLRLYKRARELGISVFFITGRPEEQRWPTERNLRAAGYEGWEHLALRDGSQLTMDTTLYKSSERKRIADAGYRIVMNIGDQFSDLNGEPRAEVNVKLPNPFYFLP